MERRNQRFYLKITAICYFGWFLAFEVIGHYASSLPAHDVTTLLDQKIPLVPGFIWFYFSGYLLPVFFFITKTNWHRFNRLLLSFIMANGSGFLVYLIFPTTFSKPQLGQGFCEWILSVQYAADFHTASNNVPSLHVTFAWLVYLAYRGQQANRLAHFAIFFLVMMITASTLFVKQHLVMDVVTGLLWAFWAWPVGKYLYPPLTDPRSDAMAALSQMLRNLAPFFFPYAALILLAVGYNCFG